MILLSLMRERKVRLATNNKKRYGLVIVTVLWVVILLGVIVAVVSRSSRLDAKVCLANTQGFRCSWASRAAMETGVAVLNEDGKASDSLKDLWAENEEDFNDIELERCSFDVQVVDEASKLNVNTATKKQLLMLPQMTDEIADSIIDWRDSDDTPKQSGVESGYYQGLRYGYKIRNGPFKTIRELLLVKGVDSDLLYGDTTEWVEHLTCYSYDNNKDADGEKRININTADENKLVESLKIKKSYAKWIVENRSNNNYESIADLINENSPQKARDDSGNDSDKAEPLDMETFRNIADKLTVTDDERIAGRVNINTAQKTVLEALLGEGETAEQIADNIITYRTGLIGGMQSIAEVMNVSSVKIDTFKKIAKHITTRSDIYSVHSFASTKENRIRSARLKTEAVVNRSTTPAGIVYWYRGVSN